MDNHTAFPPLAALLQEYLPTMRKSLLALGLSLALPFGLVSQALALTPPKIEVNSGYADDLRDFGGTIVVPTVYVNMLVEGKTFISKQGSALQTLGGGSANSVKASAKYKVVGMNKAFAQSIAKQAYDDFVKRMRDAGYTVLTYDDVKDRDVVKEIERDTGIDAEWGLPVMSPVNTSDKYVIATPSDAQQFKIGFTGAFAPFMKRGKSRLDDAVVVIPQYTIVAPQVWGATDQGYNRISAAINTAPGMNLNYATVSWVGKPHVRMGGKTTGVTTKSYVVNITEKAGEMVKTEETTPKAANGLSKALSMLGGGGSISASSANYTFTLDPAAYTEGAMNGIGAFNAQVGAYAATAKK